MNCEQARELVLADYLDDELHGRPAAELVCHLAGCVACRRLATRAQEWTIRPLQSASRAEPPAELWSRIQEQIAAGVQADPTEPAASGASVFESLGGWLRRPVLACVVVGLVLMTGIWWTRGDSTGRPPVRRSGRVALPRPAAAWASVEFQTEMAFYAGDANFETTAASNADFGTAMERLFL